jgi:SAM-dependent methyltransferase
MGMAFDPLFGASSDDWFPSPAHVMRRAAILDLVAPLPAGRLLEMGCGAGRMLVEWARLGHSGEAVDLDATARKLAGRSVKEFEIPFTVSDAATGTEFDYLVATEVLEHVERPAELLKSWTSKLRDGGIALLTVPAFPHLWGKSDEWAGHVQRFEPDQFRAMVELAGLQIIDLRLYGYPLGNILRHAGNVASATKMRNRRSGQLSRDDATFASGHDRSVETRLAPLMRSLAGRMVLSTACKLQRSFPNRGHGLVVLARKAAA